MTRRRSEPDVWNPRVDRWTARTQLPLDLFALSTIWLSFVPITAMLRFSSYRGLWISARIGLSVVFALDIGIRSWLSGRPGRYLITHPFGVLAALVPPFRLVFSLRLLRSMFRRGSLGRFLAVALLLVINGALLVVVFESGAKGASITSFPIALWWTACTVSTVGYGDYTPVTVAGRIVAVCIMAVGLTTVAVVTAQIAASFSEQAAARRSAASEGDSTAGDAAGGAGSGPDAAAAGETSGDSSASSFGDAPGDTGTAHERHLALVDRLQRIEAMLLSQERT